MMEISKDRLVTLIFSALPYSNQIQNLDTQAEENAVRFTWRGDDFRVSTGIHVDQIVDSMLHGNNISIIMEKLLERYYWNEEVNKKRAQFGT